MSKYIIKEPMPQYGKDTARIVNVPDEVVKQIRADAINDYYRTLNEKINTDTRLKDTIREIHDNVAHEMYCKGIDDLCNEVSTYRMYDEYGNVVDILEIVKRLKAGGKNE